MSLGNLHQDPDDPTKTIRTGIANIPVSDSVADKVRFFLMAGAMITSIFLLKPAGSHQDMRENAASVAPQPKDTAQDMSQQPAARDMPQP